ncbi:hypothetical protein KM043_003096 [Ampulex compressa]|nr:hypothetical protein KM043_003096 [Ampulex compressa]
MGGVYASERRAGDSDFGASSTEEGASCIPCPDAADRKPGNPGSFEDIHKKVKDLYPQNFEGARLRIGKTLSEYFSATHTITLSSVTPSGYKFGTKYVGGKRVGSSERYPVAMGEMTPNGNLNASLVHTLGCRLRYKLSAQIADRKYKAFSSQIEYRSDDCTFSLTLANPKFARQEGTMVLHFLQSITSRIALGAELAWSRAASLPAGQETIMSAAFRYDTGRTAVSGTMGGAGLHLCCYRKASRQLQLGVEIETNTRTLESIGTMAYQVDVPYADLTFRGIANSRASVAGVFEKKLHPIPESTLSISAMLNHRKQQFRIGIGLNVGQ